ncbi:MAG: YqaE/Pmp3 family membrane protein [Planctomycetaceae bacterium]
MRYLLAIVLPPVAVLLCGRPFLALLNFLLTLCLWIPGMIHALFVVNSSLANQRNTKLIRAIQGRKR